MIFYKNSKAMIHLLDSERMEKNFDRNYTRLLRAVLNKPWEQQNSSCTATYLPKTIQVRQTRHARYCWRIKDELKSDVLSWNPTHRRTSVRRPANQHWAYTGCGLEDLPRAINDRDGWWERFRELRVVSETLG